MNNSDPSVLRPLIASRHAIWPAFRPELLQASFEEGYMNDSDPSVLRFLIASRQEVTAQQLRDDLLSMLVAGHETTASVLTWTLYLLAQHPDKMAKVCCMSRALPAWH